MRFTPFLSCAALLLGLTASSAALAATAPAKKITYAVVGYYQGAAPVANLVEKAAQEICAKMKDAIAVNDPEHADRVVNIVFQKDSYRINYDGPSPEVLKYYEETRWFNDRKNAMLASAGSDDRAGGSK